MVELSEDVSLKLTELITRQVTNAIVQQNHSSLTNLVPAPKSEPIKIVKTPNMTYVEYLTRILKQPFVLKSVGLGGKSSYKLVEDLFIIAALAKQASISRKFFEDISKQSKINRSADSIMNRYNDVICHLNESDMKKITDYLSKEGIQGYLVYQNEQIKITTKDPKEIPTAKRPRQQIFDQQIVEKKAKRNVPQTLTQLNDVLAVYSRSVNIPIFSLLQYLDKTSGDLLALDRYIETKDERILWSDQQDSLLKIGGSAIEPLKRYRTEADISNRKAYLGL